MDVWLVGVGLSGGAVCLALARTEAGAPPRRPTSRFLASAVAACAGAPEVVPVEMPRPTSATPGKPTRLKALTCSTSPDAEVL